VSALNGERITLGQANGPDIELRVWGDEHYARYETPAGHSVVYDPAAGIFVYAYLVQGAFTPSDVPATSEPPPGAVLHGRESPTVRRSRASRRRGPDASPS